MREWIFVEDTCKALLRIFLYGKNGENYNIGTGIKLTNIKIAKTLMSISKNKKIHLGKNVKIKFVADRPGHDKIYALDSKNKKKT